MLSISLKNILVFRNNSNIFILNLYAKRFRVQNLIHSEENFNLHIYIYLLLSNWLYKSFPYLSSIIYFKKNYFLVIINLIRIFKEVIMF